MFGGFSGPSDFMARRAAASIETFAARSERCAWLQLGLSMLTQLDARAAFPGYNCVLALWGCYCGHSRNGRALLAYLVFLVISIVCDVIFSALWHSNELGDRGLYSFCLTVLVANMAVKAVSVFHGLHLFALVGGATSLDPKHAAGMFSPATPARAVTS